MPEQVSFGLEPYCDRSLVIELRASRAKSH